MFYDKLEIRGGVNNCIRLIKVPQARQRKQKWKFIDF